MDTMKIAPGVYQYTAVDDCSRWRVLGVYARRSAANTLKFLDHLNGQVERAQLTDRIEFWSRQALSAPDLDTPLQHWQFDYNWRRSHGGLKGLTPAGRLTELQDKTPLMEEIAAAYDESKERMRFSNWTTDRAMADLPARSKS